MAPNPGPFTLDGTNTWLVGRDPCFVIDPGPAIDAHVERVFEAARRRGGVGGIALTHRHKDHAGAADDLRRRSGAPLAAVDGECDVRLRDGDRFGPLVVVETLGHAPDHVAFVSDDVAFTGDAVLGRGSVLLQGGPGQMRRYIEALEHLIALDLHALCPGHGPIVRQPAGKLRGYIAHRVKRERQLLEAIAAGARRSDELLDMVWRGVPDELRNAAMTTMAAHLDKLDEEGRLPPDVERPRGRLGR